VKSVSDGVDAKTVLARKPTAKRKDL